MAPHGEQRAIALGTLGTVYAWANAAGRGTYAQFIYVPFVMCTGVYSQ